MIYSTSIIYIDEWSVIRMCFVTNCTFAQTKNFLYIGMLFETWVHHYNCTTLVTLFLAYHHNDMIHCSHYSSPQNPYYQTLGRNLFNFIYFQLKVGIGTKYEYLLMK